jgi:hypothetical protein
MRRTIPCRSCGGPACELELPVLDGVAAQLFRPMLRLLAAKQGFPLDQSCENPLEGLSPEAIAELLAVVCVDCVETRARPSLQVQA